MEAGRFNVKILISNVKSNPNLKVQIDFWHLNFKLDWRFEIGNLKFLPDISFVMIVNLKKVLQRAQKGRYAVPAFNINDLEILWAVLRAAEAEKSPLIIQTSEGAIEYAGLDYLVSAVEVAAKTKLPVVLHFDHGKNLSLLHKAINGGYSSVMFDGSLLPYDENVRDTEKVVRWAHARGVSVEAELGAIRGVEDLVSVSEREAILTNPGEAAEFVRKTGCDALAVAIGTSHGAYKFKGKPKLDILRLQKIRKAVKIPLVLHGASGVPQDIVKMAISCGADLAEAKGVSDSEIKKAIANGICKINIDTDLRLAFSAAVRCKLKEDKKAIDPRKILGPAMELMQDIARRKMRLCGSAGRA
jgi:fructose-bisphosphate aldolase class II